MEDIPNKKEGIDLEEFVSESRGLSTLLEKQIIKPGLRKQIRESIFAGYFLPNILSSGSQAVDRDRMDESIPNPWMIKTPETDIPEFLWHLYKRHEFKHNGEDYIAYYIETDPQWTGRWFTTFGSFTVEVDVFEDPKFPGDEPKYLYTVPSLMESFAFKDVEGMPDYRRLTDEAMRRIAVAPMDGQIFLRDALDIRTEAIMKTVDTDVPPDPRWRDILTRYGYIYENPEKPVEKETVAPPPVKEKKKLKFKI